MCAMIKSDNEKRPRRLLLVNAQNQLQRTSFSSYFVKHRTHLLIHGYIREPEVVEISSGYGDKRERENDFFKEIIERTSK